MSAGALVVLIEVLIFAIIAVVIVLMFGNRRK